MKKALLGKKLGMSQLFDENGTVHPVTLIEAGPCTVTQMKTIEKDGYSAIQVGYEDIADRKVNKPDAGAFKKAGVVPKRYVREFRLEDCSQYEVGTTYGADVFTAGEKVDVAGRTKGRGFTGVIKRWNFKIKRMSHGGGPVHRHAGSLGMNTKPGRIVKGKKMPGHYGNETVTVQNLVVVKVDAEKNIIAVRGAVPGPRGGLVTIKNAVKS